MKTLNEQSGQFADATGTCRKAGAEFATPLLNAVMRHDTRQTSKSWSLTFVKLCRKSHIKVVGAVAAQDGGALVEMALCMPILLLILTGIFSFGVAFNNDLMLTDAVSIGARNVGISRGQTTDPCADTVKVVKAAAPFLNQANLSFTFVFNGNPAHTGTTCSSASTTTGAAGELVQGKPATVTVSYPCNLTVYGTGVAPACTLTAQTTELVQ